MRWVFSSGSGYCPLTEPKGWGQVRVILFLPFTLTGWASLSLLSPLLSPYPPGGRLVELQVATICNINICSFYSGSQQALKTCESDRAQLSPLAVEFAPDSQYGQHRRRSYPGTGLFGAPTGYSLLYFGQQRLSSHRMTPQHVWRGLSSLNS